MNLETLKNRQETTRAYAVYISPQDVLDDASMTVDEKRALLASWASDVHAVENSPALRQLDNGAIVLIDDILDALKQLDSPAGSFRPIPESGPRSKLRSAIGRRAVVNLRSLARRHRDDDDDDPPPCPVAARHPRPLPIVDGAYAA